MHTYIHTHIYIYIHICVCTYVCIVANNKNVNDKFNLQLY